MTPAQLAILKADIAINTNTINGVQIKNLSNSPDNNFAIAGWYNQLTGTAFWGNHKDVPLDVIKANITHKNYTPTDAVPTDTNLNVEIHMARTLFAGAFQMAINNILLAGQSFDATSANLVSALKDATNTDMPTGVAGAAKKGGWTTLQTVICRLGTNVEKLFADTALGNGAANTTAATFTFEGQITANDVESARNLP